MQSNEHTITNCFTCLVRLLDYWACWRSIQAVPDLHGAKKGHFGPKRSLLGSLAGQKRPNISQKCAVTLLKRFQREPGARSCGGEGPHLEELEAVGQPDDANGLRGETEHEEVVLRK